MHSVKKKMCVCCLLCVREWVCCFVEKRRVKVTPHFFHKHIKISWNPIPCSQFISDNLVGKPWSVWSNLLAAIMLKFGRTYLTRFATISEIIRTLINESSINYSLLMPVILFLHSLSSPMELVTILAEEFKNTTHGNQHTQPMCLVVMYIAFYMKL